MAKVIKFLSGHRGVIGKALGLGDLPYRSLTIRESPDGPVTVVVEAIVTERRGADLVEMIEERKFYLVQAEKSAVPNGDA